jgi:hypothetical protein
VGGGCRARGAVLFPAAEGGVRIGAQAQGDPAFPETFAGRARASGGREGWVGPAERARAGAGPGFVNIPEILQGTFSVAAPPPAAGDAAARADEGADARGVRLAHAAAERAARGARERARIAAAHGRWLLARGAEPRAAEAAARALEADGASPEVPPPPLY